MKVACLQLAFDRGETANDRTARVIDLVRDLGDVDLVVLPELWHVGYFSFGRYADDAEPVDGPTISALGSVAAELNTYIHAGSIVERAPDGRLFNTSLLLGPHGRIVHTYRKIHLFGHRSEEARLLTPGDAVGTCTTDIGTIALTTCYDLRFPELYRLFTAKGAEVFLVASAWPAERLDHWRLLTRARAVDNLAYVIACNGAGDENGVELAGHSVVVDPWGDVLAEAGPEPEVRRATIELPRVTKLRAQFAVLEDRRLRISLDGD